MGTETIEIASLQQAFHTIFETGVPPDECHQYVPSTRNIKIESSWGRFTRSIGTSIALKLQEGFDLKIYNDNVELDLYDFFTLII